MGAPPLCRWWDRSHRDSQRGKEKVKERGAWGGLNTGTAQHRREHSRQRGGGRRRDEKEKENQPNNGMRTEKCKLSFVNNSS